jgi:glutathione S-transferase
LSPAIPILYSDRGCPFAHRVLALVEHLGCPIEGHESALGEKPSGVFRHSASGRIPLLAHGELAITESRVMLEYLSETFDFADAYPAELQGRTLHRHAMAVVDDFFASALFRPSDVEIAGLRLDDAVRDLATATATVSPRPCLLAFHVAPIWLRFRVWHPNGAVTRAIEANPPLRDWLDAAVALEAITRTAPDPAVHRGDLARARQAGLLPSPSP